MTRKCSRRSQDQQGTPGPVPDQDSAWGERHLSSELMQEEPHAPSLAEPRVTQGVSSPCTTTAWVGTPGPPGTHFWGVQREEDSAWRDMTLRATGRSSLMRTGRASSPFLSTSTLTSFTNIILGVETTNSDRSRHSVMHVPGSRGVGDPEPPWLCPVDHVF